MQDNSALALLANTMMSDSYTVCVFGLLGFFTAFRHLRLLPEEWCYVCQEFHSSLRETAIYFTQIDNPGVVEVIACSCGVREGSENVEKVQLPLPHSWSLHRLCGLQEELHFKKQHIHIPV